MSNQFVINSKDRTSGTSTNFVISFGSAQNAGGLKLVSAQIPNTIYNITSDNNILDFDDGGGAITATVPVGSYTITNLLSTLKTLMDAASAPQNALVFTLTLSNITHFVTIAATGNFSLLFATGANVANTIRQQIGFAGTDVAGSATYTGTLVPRVSEPFYLQIRITELRDGVVDTGANDSDFNIPINVNSGEIIAYNENSGYLQQRLFRGKPLTFTTMTVILIVDGTETDLNGAEWSFVMRIV